MKALKIIFIILAFVVVLVLIVSAFLPPSYSVQRSIIIKAPIVLVFDEINDFEKMDHWSPWKQYDPAMKTITSGIKGQPGYKFSWSSTKENVGNGFITRTGTEENRLLVNDLTFEDWDMKSKVKWMFEQTPKGVKVTWNNSGEIGYLFRIPVSLMDMEAIMAPDHEKGLMLLKKYCEEKAAADSAFVPVN